MINKTGIKATLLALESQKLQSTSQKYGQFLQESKVNASEPSDRDQVSQAEANAEIAQEFDAGFHSYTDALRIIEGTDFGDKSVVVPGAALQLSGHWYVVAVSTEPFEYQDRTFMGISTDSPVFKAAEGMNKGDRFSVNGRTWQIDAIA